jgi:hypothetical protein
MKGKTQNFRELLRPSRSFKQPKFEDKMIESGVTFKNSWAQMAHMHDLRVWSLTYSPGKKNNIRRLQEIHLLNQEMWYHVSQAIWKRIFWAIGLWFFVTRFAKAKYMKKNNNDSHDAHWRDTAAHM